jgi:hypothetical protein
MITVDKQQQGRQATHNGSFAEKDLFQRLHAQGYKQWREPPTLFPEPYFVHQHQGKFQSIYGTPLVVDFFIWNQWKHPYGLIIEIKYQEISGSVDEKFPYTIANLQEARIPSILLVFGDGARTEAKHWCLQQQNSLLTVFTRMDDWIKALNRGLL